MSASRRSFIALGAAAWITCGALPGAAAAASRPAELQLPAGSRVGLVNLLDAEVTHFHASRRLQDSFLRTYTVTWPVEAMLADAVRERLVRLGFVPVPVAAPEALNRAREECFLNSNLAKGLSKECLAPYAQIAAAEKVSAFVVLGPGLNNATHAQATRRKELPEYLRGWCLVSGEGYSPPVLLNLTELILIGITPQAALLTQREWGGAPAPNWTGFVAPADLKALPDAQLKQLQPLYAALLAQQAAGLLEHIAVAR